MPSRAPRRLWRSLAVPLGVFAAGTGIILLGIALFSGGNLLGGLGPLGLLLQVLGVAGLILVLIFWIVRLLICLIRGKKRTPLDA